MNFCFSEEERNEIDNVFPNEIETNIEHTIRVLFSRPIFSVRAILHVCADYPVAPLAVELTSKTLDERLLQKLSLLCEKEAKKHAGKPHAVNVLQFLQDILTTNRLLFCWPEIMEIKKMLKDDHSLETHDKSGAIILHAKEKGYFVHVEMDVPPEYPVQKITTKIESNFPSNLVLILDQMAKEIPTIVPKEALEYAESPSNALRLLDVRHDLQFLRNLSHLKEQSTDKAIRRQKTLFVRAEMEKEKELEQKKQNTRVSESFPHLLRIVQMIFEHWICLPHQKCSVCEEAILAPDPDSEQQPLERLHCGHFYHQKCLLKYLAAPPFERRPCHICNRKIYHPVWTEEVIRKMQKAEELKRAKEREIADALALFTD